MTIREYSKKVGFEIVGRLIRCSEWEESSKERWYIDEAGNEYMKKGNSLVIVTADGAII